MACCTNNSWSKFISVFTVIFCLAYVVVQILVLVLYEEYLDIAKIKLYIELEQTKTPILMYCSMVFNVLWAMVSAILLVFVRSSETNEYSMRETQKLIKIYISWAVLGFLSFIPDIVSMILHGLYYNNASHSTILSEASLYMLLLSSRFVVILVFHILTWIGMIIITSALHSSLVADETKPLGRIVPLKPPKPALKPSKVPYLEETNVDRVRDWYKHYEGDNKSNGNSSAYYSEPAVVPKYIPRLNGNTNPAYVDNSNYGPMSRPKSPPVPPPKPQQHHMPGTNTNVLVNGVPSGTLRRQLPWSYMPSGSELPQRVQKSQASPEPSYSSTIGGFAPYVPAPDYIKSPTKIQRQELNHPGWSQYL